MPLFNSQFNDKGVGVLAKSFTGTSFLIGQISTSDFKPSTLYSIQSQTRLSYQIFQQIPYYQSTKCHVLCWYPTMCFFKIPSYRFHFKETQIHFSMCCHGWYWPTGQNPLISLKKEVKRRSARIWLERPMILQVKARH